MVIPATDNLRRRRAKNLIATLLLSQGVPMLLAGDEFLRTQQGNNNAWCQDNEISWLNWNLARTNADFLRFVREMIALRKRHPGLRRRSFLQGVDPKEKRPADIVWHGPRLAIPDFSASSRTIAFVLDGTQTDREPDRDFYVACNARADAVPFRVPAAPSRRAWRRVVDTALASPLDIIENDDGLNAVIDSSTVIVVRSLRMYVHSRSSSPSRAARRTRTSKPCTRSPYSRKRRSE